MSNSQSLDGKEVGMFLLYVAIIAACIGVLFYILYNAQPSTEPKVKNTGGQSRLSLPQAPHATWLPLRVEEHSGSGLHLT